MLFCSQEFLVFFTVIFTVYWALRSRWASAAFLLTAGSYFLYYSGTYVPLANAARGWSLDFLANFIGSLEIFLNLASINGYYWMTGIIAVAAVVAFKSGHDRARVWLLICASFYFYASWNKWLALIICISTAMDYFIALGLDASPSRLVRRLILGISLVANLGLLVYFKYANFFLDSLHEALDAVGMANTKIILSVILPIGISFYTFEAINYTIDVYRKKTKAERNLFNFMLFITFFPHLVAGPIVRAKDFLPQIHRPKQWDWARMQLGAQFFLMGLFKKLAIADRMALFADPVFKEPEKYNSGAIWIATIAYALQIYCDFSGYTDMALGTAHLLGYKLAKNFNMPYLSLNVSEFWRRWHISLSSWLRDYLFIPLGGSRGTNWQVNRNLMLTMALGGLWHGASWTFVAWGVLHGALLIIHRGFRAVCEKRPLLNRLLESYPGMLLRMGVTFLSVCAGWVFFRSQTFGGAAIMLRRLVLPAKYELLGSPMHNRSLWYTVAVVILCHLLTQTGAWKKLAVRLPAPVLGFGYATVLTLALVLAPDSGKAFIYFQF